jgi:hypothetical protein
VPVWQLLQEGPPAWLRLPVKQQPHCLHWLLLLLLVWL